ncbi:MAG: CHASE2 domain-containing protein, partial [Akkermansiaceae bacterium]|nr:CHASE2 domain-containing protein [Akkermansiaceae bacterium]
MESNLSWFRSLLLLAIPFLWCALSHYGQLDLLENRLMDLRFLSRGEKPVPVKVVYVDVDNEAVQAYHWPWNHSRYARLIDALFDHGKIESVGFDILFSSNAEPDFGIQEQKDGRLMFGKAIHRHQNVVLAANYVPGKGLMQETRKFPWIFEGGSDPTKNDTPELPSFPVLGPTWGIPGLIDTYMGEARFAPIFADSPVGPFYPMSLRLALLHWGLSESAITRFPDRLEICKPNGELVTSVPLQRGQLVEANWFSRWISPQNLRCSVVDVERYFTLLNSPEPSQQELAKDFFAQFKDAIVLVGAVDPLLQDLGKTPLDRAPVPQVGFHGNL